MKWKPGEQGGAYGVVLRKSGEVTQRTMDWLHSNGRGRRALVEYGLHSQQGPSAPAKARQRRKATGWQADR